MNNKRFAWLILWIAISLNTLQAQTNKKQFSPEEFKQKLENYITKNAGLTEEEAKAFFPIYSEMKQKQGELMKQIRQLKKNARKEETKDSEYSSIVSQINKLKIESAEVEAKYYLKICKSVSPKKVFEAMRAEDKFHRESLRRMNRPNNSLKHEGKNDSQHRMRKVRPAQQANQ
ncbi:MAG: hypothetical protein NC388_10645 [Clostridium sp.]|nr:hypothetical protein [Clostridium sp.]